MNHLNRWHKGGHLDSVKSLVNYLSSAQASCWILIWNHPLSNGGRVVLSIDCEQVCRRRRGCSVTERWVTECHCDGGMFISHVRSQLWLPTKGGCWRWGPGQHSLVAKSLSLLTKSAGCELTLPNLCALCGLSHVWLFATPWTAARQAPLSMGFSRQEYRTGLPFPSPADLPDTGMELTSPGCPPFYADSLPLSHHRGPCPNLFGLNKWFVT